MALTYLNSQMIDMPLSVPTLSARTIQSPSINSASVNVTNVSSTNVFAGNIYVNDTLKNVNWDTAFTTVQTNSSSWVNPLSSLTWSVSAPSLSSDPGIAGNVAYDLNFFYVAVSANTWKRLALSTF